MFLVKFLLLFLLPLSSYGSDLLKSQSFLAANDSNYLDPFIDYGEFQDNVTEQESINFFQKGRTLNISILTGYEAITFNIRQIYGDSPGTIGVSIGFFFDLNFAIHVSGMFPHPHYNSLLGTSPTFSSINIDFKYYFKKQKLIKSAADFFSPYFIFGPFSLKIGNYNIQDAQTKQPAVPTNLPGSTPTGLNNQPQSPPNSSDVSTLGDFKSIGFKLGVGIEVPCIKQTYIGAEVSYLYTNLDHFENADLSDLTVNTVNTPNKTFFDRLIFPDTPQVKGYRFYGDMINVLFIFGVNF